MQAPIPATTEESSPLDAPEPKERPGQPPSPLKRFAEGLTRTAPNAVELFALVVYSAVIVYVAQFHEPWRDEVRAWSLVRECEHVWEIFPRLRNNEGHPGLWYVLLFYADQVFRTPRVLPWLAAAIAIVAAGLFLWRAPFPRWQKLLFLAGVVPLYEYSVMARNYGIGMLLLFCTAASYGSRFERGLVFGSFVFLLSNTNAYCLLACLAIFGATLLELVMVRRDVLHTARGRLQSLGGLSLMLLGCVASVLQVRTNEETNIGRAGLDQWFGPWVEVLLRPVALFSKGFGVAQIENSEFALAAELVLSAALLAILMYLARTPFVLLIWLGSYVAMGALSTLVYPADLRHQAVVFLLLLAALWMARSPTTFRLRSSWFDSLRWRRASPWALQLGVGILLLPQIAAADLKIRTDLEQELSSASAFAEFLQSSPELRDAILVGDPDYLIETMPYYVPNRIYLPREGRFRNFASNSIRNRPEISLAEFLDTARSLRARFNKPVVIALHPRLKRNRRRVGSSVSRITYSPQMFDEFQRATKRVARFRSVRATNETYDIFVLR
jgi:hypothetical protein